MLRLETDGDLFEREYWRSFVACHFPSYETFWQREVLSITNRTEPFFLSDDQLEERGKSPLNHYLAQLHYTVLFHLGTSHNLAVLRDEEMDYTRLMDGFSRLVAAQDVAFELLSWWTNPSLQKEMKAGCLALPEHERLRSFERKAKDVNLSKKWASNQAKELEGIRKYRNAMMHRGARSAWIVNDTVLFPLMGDGQKEKYCDWRTEKSSGDFGPASQILWPAWKQTVDYLEDHWRSDLLGWANSPQVSGDEHHVVRIPASPQNKKL
jgi:hypothetical protein